jgi:hypothetical protein
MSDVNRLKEILNKSKAIMQVTEENYGSSKNITQSITNESEEKEIPNLTENFIRNNQRSATKSVATTNGKYRNLEKSKMPDVIKKAMLENPIEIPETPFHTFELDDVSDFIHTNYNQENIQESKKSSLTENTSLNLNDTVIRKIVKEEMMDVVRTVIEEYFEKSLVTEDIQIRVGGTTFSGKLKPLPNKKK